MLTAAATVVAGPLGWLQILDQRAEALHTGVGISARAYPGAAVLADPTREALLPEVAVVPAPELAHEDFHDSKFAGCLATQRADEVVECVYGDVTADRRVYLVGSSHAANFLAPLDLVGQRHAFAVHTFLKMGCAWGRGGAGSGEGDGNAKRASCVAWSDAVVDRVLTDPPDLLVTPGTRPRVDSSGDHVPAKYVRRWRPLVRAGVPVVAIRDNPWLPFDAPACVAEAQEHSGPGTTARQCAVPRASVLSENTLSGAARRVPRVAWIDLSDQFCRPTECRAVEGNVLVYRDDNHVTATYGRTLAPELARQLGAASGWWGPVHDGAPGVDLGGPLELR